MVYIATYIYIYICMHICMCDLNFFFEMLLHGHTMRELWVGVYSILRIFQKTYQGIYLWSQTFSIGSYRIPTIPTVSYR